MPIHPTTIIGDETVIDPTTEIGPYVIIENNVRIGKNNRIMAHVFIGRNTIIGDNNEIHIGAVLGHTPQDKKFKGTETTYLRIGNGNIIREYVAIHRATIEGGATTIGNDCFLMGGCHIAHDCQLGNSIIMANMAGLAGHVHIESQAFISGGAMIHQFVKVGRLAILSGNSRFSMDIPPFVIAAEHNQIWGINVIGLRRANFTSSTIRELKELYRLFFFDPSPRSLILEKLENHKFQSPEVQEFLTFIRNSKRGICRAKRFSRSGSEEKSVELSENPD